MNILVTDGENRSALAVTRSLGRVGHTVMVAESAGGSIAACSRFCSYAYRVPDPAADMDSYAQAISEIVRREKVAVVVPMTEQSVYSLNLRRDLFGDSLLCPDQERMEAVSDKFALFRRAARLGVPIPRTIFVKNIGELASRLREVERFPVVVKPAFSKFREGGRILSARVMYAADAGEVERLYATVPALRHPSLIQELIEGEGTGLFTLFDRDRHLALFAHRRILEKPPSGGVSVLSESIPLDRRMVEDAGRLLASVGWKGIAMVEFKRDQRDGRARLMEINGRFWGSLQLAVSAGVDFPKLLLDYHLGRCSAVTPGSYRTGVRLKWYFGVLDHLLIRLRNRKQSSPHPGLPPLGRVLRELLPSRGANTAGDVYDAEDLQPFYSEARSYFRDATGW